MLFRSTNEVTGTKFNFLNGSYTATVTGGGATANYSLNLPANAGVNGEVLSTDGTGNLSWISAGGSTGNIGFTGDAIYDLNGITLENADLSHGATAALILPSNGTGNIELNNTYGNIKIQTGPTGLITSLWTFSTAGNLTLPSGGSINSTTGTANLANVYLNSGYIETPGSAPINLVAGGTGGVRIWNKLVPNANVGQNIGSSTEYWGNAYVSNVIAAGNITGNTNGYTIGYLNVPQVSASNTTIGLTDAGKHYYSTTAGNLTLTIPNNTTTSFATGTAISIVVQAAGNILVNAASGVTLYMAGNSTSANRVVGTYGMATLLKVATDTWFINGTGVS